MKFVVKGEMVLGRERRKFAKEIEAPSEKRARELAYSVLGSGHGLVRSRIVINEIAKAA